MLQDLALYALGGSVVLLAYLARAYTDRRVQEALDEIAEHGRDSHAHRVDEMSVVQPWDTPPGIPIPHRDYRATVAMVDNDKRERPWSPWQRPVPPEPDFELIGGPDADARWRNEQHDAWHAEHPGRLCDHPTPYR